MAKIVVVIPAFRPDEELIRLAEQLHKEDLDLLIVNDGSEAIYDPIFEAVTPFGKVLRAPFNEGKGAALKRGITALPKEYPDCTGFITADADGQHRPADILRVKERLEAGNSMVLTVRRLKGKIPARSKFGNDLSRIVYTVMNGHYFDDNQSGLRGFDLSHREWLLEVQGNKYDYEMNVLCYADKQQVRIDTLPIDAVYIDGNKSSHFNPVADTVRIYKRLFSSVWASCLGVLVWAVLSVVSLLLWGYRGALVSVPGAVMLSATLTVLLNRYVVFRKIRYRDGVRTYLCALIRAAVYTGVLFPVAVFLPQFPPILALALVSVLVVPMEYYLHKFRHGIMHKK